MGFADELIDSLQDYDDVIIYGFEDIGNAVFDFIMEYETDTKRAGYKGRVKYFTCTSMGESTRKSLKGIPIRPVDQLTDYKKSALVIVSVREQSHPAISKVLSEYGFENILFISRKNYHAIRIAVENRRLLVNNSIQNFHINHRLKLQELRRRVKEGHKIKVFFWSVESAYFHCDTVYKSMEADDLFEPYIYVMVQYDIGNTAFLPREKKEVEYFRSKGYRVIEGYDEAGIPLDIHKFSPDIIFFDYPQMYGDTSNGCTDFERLSWDYLTIFNAYGFNVANTFYYHYQLRAEREAWKHMIYTPFDYRVILEDLDFNANNAILTGSPKLDEYCMDVDTPPIFENDNPIVIYAPHHSLGYSNNWATFDLYKDYMLELVKSNPDINFVIKPHPDMPAHIAGAYSSGRIDFGVKEYEAFISEWGGLKNGAVFTEGGYIPLFKKSTCLITDSGSFIAEYLPSLHPCIYLYNPRRKNQDDGYTALANSILDTYYKAYNKDEIGTLFNQLVCKKNDIKFADRKKLNSQVFGGIGSIGESIKEMIKEEALR